MSDNKTVKFINNEIVYRSDIEKQAIETFGEKAQKIKAAEECAELIQALSKEIGSGGKDERVLDNVAEEIADVKIMLEQLQIIYGNSERVEEYETQKIRRLSKYIQNYKNEAEE